MSIANLRWRSVLNVLVGMILLCGAFSVIRGLLFPVSPPTLGPMIQSKSAVGHFVISHPADWQFGETPSGLNGDPTIIAYVSYRNLLKVGVDIEIHRSLSAATSIDQVSSWGEQIARERDGYREIALSPLFVRGEASQTREYTYSTPTTPIQSSYTRQCLDDYRLHKGTGYILSMCVEAEDFSALEPVFQDMINSFAFTD